MGIYKLHADAAGQSLWIDREAEQMGDAQFIRELIVNGAEAGATSVAIDGWEHPDTGRTLMRFSDDGHGMSEAQLKKHMSTLHLTGKEAGKNYGIGARIASMFYNPAGVDFASRKDGDESQVTLIKERGVYGMKEYPILDEYGRESKSVTITPESGLLDLIGSRSGTAVTLRGDGRRDTYTQSTFNDISRYIARRFFTLPGEVTVRAKDLALSKRNFRTIKPMSDRLDRQAIHSGDIPFRDVDGMNGVIHWWTVKPGQYDKSDQRDRIPGGVGFLVDGEVFSYSNTHSADFGLIYRRASSRVVVLVEVVDSRMDTGRSGIVMPKRTSRAATTSMPWKTIGRVFAENMPDPVREILDSVKVIGQSLDEKLAAALDADWFKKIDPIPVADPSKDGDAFTSGEEGLDALNQEPAVPSEERDSSTPAVKSAPAKRNRGGDNPVGSSRKRVLPQVKFIPAAEAATFVQYLPDQGNVILVSDQTPPYLRAVEQWVSATPHNRQTVEDAVRAAYSVELGAQVIDANAQIRFDGVSQEMVEEMKSSAALYAKLLGVQAIEKTIEQELIAATRSAE